MGFRNYRLGLHFEEQFGKADGQQLKDYRFASREEKNGTISLYQMSALENPNSSEIFP